MTLWAAMVMRKIYVNAQRTQSKRNGAGPFDCRTARCLVSAREHQGDSRQLRDRRVSQDARDGI
jgi:hypothetical protein